MMKEFDSLGARQLPKEEAKPIGIDWQGEALYPGDVVYITDSGYVTEEELEEYAKYTFAKIELGGI